jgi:hypothetical protein
MSVECAKFTATQERTKSSKQCQISVDFFNTEGFVYKEFIHQDRP